MLERARHDLAGRGLMTLGLGQPLDSVYDLDVVESQMEVAATIADRSGLWSMPLGVHYLDEHRGVFAEHSSSGWQFIAYYPGSQTRLEGWYAEFEIDPWNAISGSTAVVRLQDDESDPDSDHFTKIVSGGVVLYSDSVAGAGDAATVEVARPNVVTVRLEVTDVGFSHSPVTLESRIEDELGETVEIADADYEFRTGVAPLIVESYERQTSRFVALARTLRERGDIDVNGAIGFGDILAVIAAWGTTGPDLPEDLDDSGDVGFPDLVIVLSGYGATCVSIGS
jgi:hypothetical protein